MAVSTRTAPVRFNASGALKTVKSIWGRDKVEYYQWATRGSHYCNKVRAAALQVRDWDEAVLKLNRIIYRRVGEAGRLRVKESVNPIECGDWIHLKSWSHKGPYLAADGKREIGLPIQQLVVADLPTGFGFDQFGLLVRKECQADVDRSGQQLEGPRPRPRRRPSPLGENEPHRKRARRVGPRARLSSESQLEAQRTRGVGRRETSDEQLREEVTRSLDRLEEEFAEKERLSREQTWCEPIPLDRKVSTVRNFHKAFHDPTTLPIRTCMACYQKCAPVELETIEWDMWVRSGLGKRVRSPFACRQCFPPGQTVSACRDCAKHLRKGGLSPAGYVHMGLGCEHMYPVELEGLTVVEQKLIGLYSCYGLITKHIIPKERKREQWRQNASYPKHVKGHVTVFPNNVQELASKVLPHLLVKVMEEIHVSWQGPKEPTRSDLSAPLSVRRHVVERALNWLKENNPLYADIHINTDEMDTWEGPSSDGVYVPSVIYNRMERNEPTVYEKVRTAQLVPSVERGLEEDQSKEIIEIVAELERGEGDTDGERGSEEEEDPPCGENEAEGGQGGAAGTIHEITSSGMFALDDGPDVTDGEKLRHAYQALGSQDTVGSRNAGSSTMTVSNAQSGKASEPYIVVSRGEEFADSFDARFFAKTFPTLFPWGTGGPKLAEESTDGDQQARMRWPKQGKKRKISSHHET